MNDAELTKQQNIQSNSQVYIDPKTEILFTKLAETKNRVKIGGVCGYFASARTCLSRYSISKEYFAQCKPISETSELLDNDKNGHLQVRGYDCLYNDFWYKRISHNPEFKYLHETDRLVKANTERYPPYHPSY